jgi:hypothetical protein
MLSCQGGNYGRRVAETMQEPIVVKDLSISHAVYSQRTKEGRLPFSTAIEFAFSINPRIFKLFHM